jgi:glycosyltransferase involved in cell wall biosynthesis
MRLQPSTSESPDVPLSCIEPRTEKRRSSRGHRYDVGFYAPSLAWRLAGVADTGGAETQLMLITRGLAERGFAVCVVAFAVPGLAVPASDQGVDVVLRPTHLGGGSVIGQVREAAAVFSAVRRIDAGLVVTRCAGFWVGLVGMSSKLSGRRFVYSSASLLDFKSDYGLRKWRDRVLFRLGIGLADEIVVQTEEQVRLCKQRFGRTPILIRSVSEPAEPSGLDAEVFVWTGRVEQNKRPLDFVELARALPEARFRMIAPKPKKVRDLPLWEQIERAATTLPNFDLVPPLPRTELLELLGRAVAVVSTSKFEGMPNVFLEAWSRGVPALALNHDPDGVITRYELGGFAEGRFDRLVDLAGDLWNGRSSREGYCARCRTYVEANHSPATVSEQWARALDLSKRVPVATSVIGAS